jgi:hypothetical protein
MTSIRDTYSYDPYYIGPQDHPVEDPYERTGSPVLSDDLVCSKIYSVIVVFGGSGGSGTVAKNRRSSADEISDTNQS